MNAPVWLVVVLYKPREQVLRQWQKIKKVYPTVFIDNTVNNIGYAAGANEGGRKAFAQGVQWVLLLNQDVVLNAATLDELTKKIRGVAPSVIGPFAGTLDTKRWTTIYPGKVVDYLSGSCLLIHKHVFEKLNGFYEPYFMYYEDVDFCIRAKRKGFPIRYVSISGIMHKDKKNTGVLLEQQRYYLARNHLLFVWRLAPWHVKLYELLRLPKTLYEYWH